MNLRKLALMTATCLLTVACLFFFSIKPAGSSTEISESNEITLLFSPLAAINHSAVPGQQFALNVSAYNVKSVHGYRMRIDYDSNLIKCLSVSEGRLFSNFGNTTFLYTIDDTLGEIQASANLTSPEAVATGNGSLIRLTFSILGSGETKIGFQDVSLYDSSGSPLPYVTIDGYFNNKLNVDFTMPIVLSLVTIASVFTFGKVEGKMKSLSDEREFRIQDVVLLVGFMSVMMFLIVFVRQITLILMVMFLFAYSMLLFTFAYVFSRNRWYIGILPPAVFILLYIFVRDSSIWTLYLSNIYGLVFAILITLYLAGLFTWKATAIFGVLLTGMDIVLVLVTGTMVQAAQTAMSLNLPVLVTLPLLPLIATGAGFSMLSLGLGDFFFAGLLGVQTAKRYGRRFALLTVVGMAISFFLFEVLLLNYLRQAFPGTLMIICGWAPLVIGKELAKKKPVTSAAQM